MNAYEQLLYIGRLLVITVSAAILVLILNLASVDVDSTSHYHIDTHTMQVLYGADFWVKPGVLDLEAFSNTDLDEVYSMREEPEPLYIVFSVEGINKTLNEQAREEMTPFVSAGVQGVYKETTTLPITVHPDTPSTMTIEAYYEQ